MTTTTTSTTPADATTPPTTTTREEEEEEEERNPIHSATKNVVCGDDDDDDDIAFASMDFQGVDFDRDDDDKHTGKEEENAKTLQDWERKALLSEFDWTDEETDETLFSKDESEFVALAQQLLEGRYVSILAKSPTMKELLLRLDTATTKMTLSQGLYHCVVSYCRDSSQKWLQVSLVAVAAFQLYLQLNYTGPSMEYGVVVGPQEEQHEEKKEEQELLRQINPHEAVVSSVVPAPLDHHPTEPLSPHETTIDKKNKTFENVVQNAILAELSLDCSEDQNDAKNDDDDKNNKGEPVVLWPCPLAQVPYMLLLAKSFLQAVQDEMEAASSSMLFPSVSLWLARVCVAHQRLNVQSSSSSWVRSSVLWKSVQRGYTQCLDHALFFPNQVQARLLLEYGLAHHHFYRHDESRSYFWNALEKAGLHVHVKGATGKRTKYQKKATVQMLIQVSRQSTLDAGTPIPEEPEDDDDSHGHDETKEGKENVHKENPTPEEDPEQGKDEDEEERVAMIQSQEVPHAEDEILLDRVTYDDAQLNSDILHLSTLEQCILLSLSLQIKTDTPGAPQDDDLTGEQMGVFLARVLRHADDWMIYATALLERAWVESERVHGRERSLLQLQALKDQHDSRLTLTQSTVESVTTQAAPVQQRLRNVHALVYPPRWELICDLADRYAKWGIVTSAAELYQEVDLWDEVVQCLRLAGREGQAKEIVEQHIQQGGGGGGSPRMYMVYGDLTHDVSYYHESLKRSHGRFSPALVALGQHYLLVEKNLSEAARYYAKAVEQKPLLPKVWFTLGTIYMELQQWNRALAAFSQVAAQQPEMADAWSNVAAIHMRNKNPAEAYPALLESLKQNRNNWRVWESKLYTCLDLKKYDEAIQACHELLRLRQTHPRHAAAEEEQPRIQERCIRAIVGGSLEVYLAHPHDESAKRTVDRVGNLLTTLSSHGSEAWIWETVAFFQQHTNDEPLVDVWLKEFRTLQATVDWERKESVRQRLNVVVPQIVGHFCTQESWTKAKLLLRGVLGKLRAVHGTQSTTEMQAWETLLDEVEKEQQKAKEKE